MCLVDWLEKLCLTPAPSGYEVQAACVYRDLIAPYADRMVQDRAGNIIATVNGTNSRAPSVMVFAHLDQLGFIVRKIESDGFLQIDRLGGIPEKVLAGIRICIRTLQGEYVPGVIGNKSHHASAPEEKYRVDPVTSLYVDVGVQSAAEVRAMGVEIGCPAVYAPSFVKLGNSCVSGTAMDNRGGVAAMVQAAQLLHLRRPESTVHFVGGVWEEFNIRGAALAARYLRPDIALCLDVVLSGDTQDLGSRYESRLGAGPALNLYTFHGRGTLNGTIAHPGLVQLAREVAIREELPLQSFASLGMLTDSAYVQMEAQGIACLDMGFAVRYTHSPVETCAVRDVEQLGTLVAATCSAIRENFDPARYRVIPD